MPEALQKADIYPSILHEGEEAFEYLYAYFVELQKFYPTTSAKELAVIVYINYV